MAAAVLVSGALWRVMQGELSPGTFDEVSFMRALAQFDLLAFEPHFPGYVLTILLARIPHALGSPVPYAWIAGLLGLATGPWVYRAAGRGAGGVLACAVVGLAPLGVGLGTRALADATGSALLVGGVALALKPGSRGPALAGFVLGAAAAAKPDYALWGTALLPATAYLGAERRTLVLTFGAWCLPVGFAAWGAALGCGGWSALIDEGSRFVAGHVFEWGGTVAASSEARTLRFALPLGGAVGATGVTRGWVVLAALALMCRAPCSHRRAVVCSALPYALYTLLAQNLDHPRHLLPLVGVGALLAGQGANRIRVRPLLRTALVATAIGALVSGTLRESSLRNARGRRIDAVLAVMDRRDPLQTRLYASLQARALRERRPGFDVRAVRDLNHLDRLLAADPAPPPLVLISDDVPGVEQLGVVADGVFVRRWTGPR